LNDEPDTLDVDGVEVAFVPMEGGVFRLMAEGREIGRVELARGSTELVAYRPDGEPLRSPNVWGGAVTTRFGSRSLAARALLKG
jgi:hypothetical protein